MTHEHIESQEKLNLLWIRHEINKKQTGGFGNIFLKHGNCIVYGMRSRFKMLVFFHSSVDSNCWMQRDCINKASLNTCPCRSSLAGNFTVYLKTIIYLSMYTNIINRVFWTGKLSPLHPTYTRVEPRKKVFYKY